MKSLINCEFGCPCVHISNLGQPLDFIEYLDRRNPRVIEIIGPLYLKGLSITEIQSQTGIPRATIHGVIKKNRHILNPPQKVPFERWRRGSQNSRRQPPYGFGWLNGELVKDPKEYPTIQLIERLWNQKKSVGEIVRYLNEKSVRTRMNREWGYGVVKNVLKRIKN